MIETLKIILLDPLFLFFLALVFFEYTLLGLKIITGREYVLSRFYKVVIFACLLALVDVTVFPISRLRPSLLLDPERQLFSVIFQVATYAYLALITAPKYSKIHKNMVSFSKKKPLLGFFLLFCLFSFSWSSSPIWTLNASILIVGISLLSVHISCQISVQYMESNFRYVCLLVALASFLAATLFPSIGVIPTGWQGILPHSIRLGTLMALGSILWLNRVLSDQKKLFSLAVSIFMTAVMIFADSAQAYFTFIFLLILLLILEILKKLNSYYLTVAAIFSAPFVSVFVVVVIQNWVKIFGMFGKDATLTGRTYLWPFVIDAIAEKPIFGYGVMGFWQPWRGSENPAYALMQGSDWIVHAHNGFLDLTLQVGILGLIFFLLSFVWALVEASRYYISNKNSWRNFPIIVLVYIISANITETQLFQPTYIWFLYIFIITRMSSEIARLRTAKVLYYRNLL